VIRGEVLFAIKINLSLFKNKQINLNAEKIYFLKKRLKMRGNKYQKWTPDI